MGFIVAADEDKTIFKLPAAGGAFTTGAHMLAQYRTPFGRSDKGLYSFALFIIKYKQNRHGLRVFAKVSSKYTPLSSAQHFTMDHMPA